MIPKYIVRIIVFIGLIVLGANAQTPSGTNKVHGGLVLLFELRSSNKRDLQYAFELRNEGSKAVFYSADPRDVVGTKTPYVSIDENDKSLLNVQWRVFDRDIVWRIENGGVNKTGIELKRLEPGGIARSKLSIKWPLEETSPPSLSVYQKKIDRSTVKRIRFTIGYFEEEEGILEFLKRKPFGWFITGTESLDTGIPRGKRFYEIQKLVSSEVSIPEIRD